MSEEQSINKHINKNSSYLLFTKVEDGYTRELLEAEEREKDLRTRLAGAEERALHASSSVDRAK